MGGRSTKITRSSSVTERRFSRKSSRHRRTKSDMPTTEQLLSCPDYIRPPSRPPNNFIKRERPRNIDLPTEAIDIPYSPMKQGGVDVVCSYCGVYTGNENHPCKVCDLVFHKICLGKYYVEICNGSTSCLLNPDVSFIGDENWTCHTCEDLVDLLTVEEYQSLMRRFDRFGVKKDSIVTHANFLKYQRGIYNTIHGEDMKPDEMRKSMQHFEHMDVESKGEIAWKDFMNSETVRILKQRPKHKITHLLTSKEIEEMHAIFKSADNVGQGSAKQVAVRSALIKWLIKRKKVSIPKPKPQRSSFDEKFAKDFVHRKSLPEENSKTISWQEFVTQYALAVIATRSNTFGFIYTDEYMDLKNNI
ncbi:PHD finger protein 24-like [Argonauta hians]